MARSHSPNSRRAEKALADSAAISTDLASHRKAWRKTEGRLIARRRRLWLRAVEAPDSAVNRQRIATACGVSIQLVDAELKAARAEVAGA